VNTDKIAKKINIEHKNVIAHITKYKNSFEEIDRLVVKIEKSKKESKGGRPSIVYDLSDNQIKFLIMLLKNDIYTIRFKKDIILGNFDIENFKKDPIKGFVYIIQNKEGYYKIGSTINPKERIRSIETQQGCKVEIISISEPRFDYIKKEIEIHKRFNHKRQLGEYFDLNDRDIKNAVCMLFDTSLDNIKLSANKYLYDNDKKSYLKLYLIELAQVLDGKSSSLYIFPATIEIAKHIFEKENKNKIENIYQILEKEISNYLDLYFGLIETGVN